MVVNSSMSLRQRLANRSMRPNTAASFTSSFPPASALTFLRMRGAHSQLRECSLVFRGARQLPVKNSQERHVNLGHACTQV